jgi:hypothetical protein
MENEINALLSLLDDEDENIALNAMARLLELESFLGDKLGQLQESDNPLLRKRGHQLQVAITLRARRKLFFKEIQSNNFDFIVLLLNFHLLWFDNDSEPKLFDEFAKFESSFDENSKSSLKEIASNMKLREFNVVRDSTIYPEIYCLGSILNEQIAAQSVICAILKYIVQNSLQVKIIRFMNNFGLLDNDNMVLWPGDNWQITKLPNDAEVEYWNFRDILKYIGLTLFSSAVNSDSFRYVLTLAQTLTGDFTLNALSSLPYPFCTPQEMDDLNIDDENQ